MYTSRLPNTDIPKFAVVVTNRLHLDTRGALPNTVVVIRELTSRLPYANHCPIYSAIAVWEALLAHGLRCGFVLSEGRATKVLPAHALGRHSIIGSARSFACTSRGNAPL